MCDGFVSLMDLTATFYEAAGVKPKEKMDSRSLIPVFKGDYTACRKEIYSDRERHTNTRPGGYGYPMRSVQDKDFLYIRNLYPDRLPAGTDPVYGDTGHGPAKAFMVFQRDKYPKEIFDRAFGLRPAEELYDLRKDPGCLNNVAAADFLDEKDFRSTCRSGQFVFRYSAICKEGYEDCSD